MDVGEVRAKVGEATQRWMAGDAAGAARIAGEVVELDPTSRDGWDLRTAALMAMGDIEAAWRSASGWASHLPPDPKQCRALLLTSYLRGDAEATRGAVERTLELPAQGAPALASCAAMAADLALTELAVRAADLASACDPEDDAVLRARAWVEFKQSAAAAPLQALKRLARKKAATPSSRGLALVWAALGVRDREGEDAAKALLSAAPSELKGDAQVAAALSWLQGLPPPPAAMLRLDPLLRRRIAG